MYPHRPVLLTLKTDLDKLTVHCLKKYAKLPVDLPVGPAPEPPDYQDLVDNLEGLLQPLQVPEGYRLPRPDEVGGLQA
eukprot:2491933-Pyramimonas_sp.AAC.1